MNRTSVDIRKSSQPKHDAKERLSNHRPPKGKDHEKKRETFHALKMQKTLSTVSYGQRSSVKSQLEDYERFDDFPLLSIVQDSIGSQVLPGMKDLTPTPVQSLAIPALLGVESRASRRRMSQSDGKTLEQYLLAAETGSGKTLAYILPVIDAIKRAEQTEAEEKRQEPRQENSLTEQETTLDPSSETPHDTTARPRAIILLPTSELVVQVGSVVKQLSHTIKFRSALISSAISAKVIRNRLFTTTGIDVVISTPHLLASIAQSEPNILSRVSHLVVDEADSLLDRSFASSTSAIIDKATPSLRQLILCSATIPRSLDSYLRNRFPDVRRLVTPNLHAIPRRVQLSVVDIDKQPYVGNRMLACADTIWSIGKAANEETIDEGGDLRVTRLLVFVNERETATQVAEYLTSKGIDAVAFQRDSASQREAETLAEFTMTSKGGDRSDGRDGKQQDPKSRGPRPSSSVTATRHLANTKVLVSTDLGSRGIDTLAVKHVLLYDVPHTTIDFIHRLGRTGRMGRRGKGVVLVGKNDRKDIVREVREGMYKGQALI